MSLLAVAGAGCYSGQGRPSVFPGHKLGQASPVQSPGVDYLLAANVDDLTC
jgi:hypothetical protein